MRHAVRKVLAMLGGSVLIAACSGLNGLSGDQNNEGAEYLRRWKVTDAAGKVLSQGCTKQADPGSRYCANVISVHAATGTMLTYDDNLGGEFVHKKRANRQLPTSDTYWCSNQDTYQDDSPWLTKLDAVQVADADPAATIIDVQLIKPHQDPQYGTVAEGFRLQLKVLHPGLLHLGFLGPADLDAGADAAADAGADGGTQLYNVYPAMTIQ